MATQHALPFTVPGATPAKLEDITPWRMTTHQIADTDAGGLGAPEMAAELAHFLEHDAPLIPWWNFPGVQPELAKQPGMTPTRVAALVALAGRSDDVTLAEVGRRYHMQPAQLRGFQVQANTLMQRYLARKMEGINVPIRRYTVQTLRERKALSIAMLAQKAGVAPRTVWRAANGQPIRPGNKQRIAAALQEPPEAIKWEQAG